MPHGGQHPTEEAINITRKFLGGELGTPGQAPGVGQGSSLPRQAAPIAGQRAFGQRGQQQRRPVARTAAQPLSDRFFGLPGPVGFAQTPQGRAILQRILGGGSRRI